jgi:hypothetical protein
MVRLVRRMIHDTISSDSLPHGEAAKALDCV